LYTPWRANARWLLFTREALRLLDRRDERRIRAKYATYREADGRWLLSVRGHARERTPADVARLPP
jgi:hypothetical protein